MSAALTLLRRDLGLLLPGGRGGGGVLPLLFFLAVAMLYLRNRLENQLIENTLQREVANLVAQVESARRFKVDLSPYPNVVAIDNACAHLPAFEQAAPKNQPDAF